MSGVETGLDLTAAMARVPADIDARTVRQLLLDAEPRALAAMAQRREELESHGKA
ncbi:hypothetical protein [Parvibaculum sp.]|uniref:hypothetical protein n=1 Tax=Parvibaculum sp. TaxID=2024848 RepID=UPI0025F5E56A|nr:hypothetical protein [Parvibaculum sp.]|tara:strand:- start:7209 stop:7373 length:165 start_codon:yes stop_codon:yes gene_type:complete